MRGVIAMATILTMLPAAYAETALDAVKQLPKEQAARVARIEARGGTPDPDRWYILTEDPAAENGVHEFVVSNGEIVASRAVSQFAESLKEGDMLGAAPLKIDSDKAEQLARDYAEANGAVVTSMNYELKKDGPDAAPAWTVSCLDDKGNKVGSVVVTAGKGNVVSHDGFTIEPEPEETPGPTPKKRDEPRFETYARPDVAKPDAVKEAQAGGSPAADRDDETKAAHHHRHHTPEPEKKPDSPVAKTFKNVSRTVLKYLPF
jgi:hypothetical protein